MQRLIKSPLPAIAAIAALVLLIPLCISLADAAIDSPVPVASVADGSAYPELAGAWDITTVVINASTYALVTGSHDLGVQIIDITDPASPTHVAAIIDGQSHSNSKKFDTLSSPHGITTVDIGTSTYALVASSHEGGIQIINITDPADPAPVVSIRNDKTYPKLAGAWDVTTVKINSSTYAMVTSNESTNGGGVQIINITNPADPAPVSSFGNGDAVTVGEEEKTYDTLAGANGITTVNMGSSTYALVTAYYDNGVQIINITNPASPVPAASITDNSTINLAGAVDITTVKIDSSTYALVAAYYDNGVQIINITNPASPVPAASITDNSTINLAGAYGITTVTDGSSTYALVAASTDNGVQIIDITNPASPVPAASITDEQEHDNGKTFDELEGAHGITTVTDGSSTYALVASTGDNGVQIIDISTAAEEESTTDRQPSTQSDTDAITTSKQTSADATSVPADWGLIPSGLGEGQDRFRLLIVTSTEHNATSSDIAVYDTFVQNLVAAGHEDIQEYSSSFRVVGSTSTVDARNHTGTTHTDTNKGPPIYWLDGAKVADNYQDFYDGSWDEERSARNENGDEFVFGTTSIFTGSKSDGTKASFFYLGNNLGALLGLPNIDRDPLTSDNPFTSSETLRFYGISPVFQIGTTNAAPIADAGPNQHVQERDTVTLDGTNSADPDNGDDTTLTYSWSQTSGTPAVTLANANTTSPTFTAPSTANFTALTFALTTNDGSLSSNNDTVTVTVYDDQTIFARSATYYENHGILGITFNKDVNLLISTELDLFHIRESGSDDGGSNLLSSKLLITTGSTAHFKLDSSTDSAVRALASPEADIEPDFTYSQGGFSFDYDQNDLPIKSGAFLPLIESVTLAARDELTVRFLSNVDTDITNGTGWILFGADVTAANLAIESNSDPGGIKDTMTLALNASLPGTATRFDDVHVKYQRPSGDGGGIFNGTEYLGNTADIKAADGLPPVPVSAAAASAMSTSITVTFSENVLGSHGAGSFSLSRAAGSATTTPVPAVVPETIFTDSETLTLNLNSTIGNNDLTVAYNQDLAGSGIADVAGNPVASFEGIPVGTQSAPTPPTPPDGNAPPTASIAAPARAAEGTTVTLVGTGSSDSDGTISLYAWTANNTSITIIDADKAEASFTAPQVTANATLVITLKVTDDDGATGSANHTMTLYDTNRLPAADAGPNQHVQEGDTVTLDGTRSADPDDGDTLTYSWSQTSGTPTVPLTNADTASPTFTAPSTANFTALTFALTTNDGSLSSNNDTVTVTVYDDQTIFARSATYYENHGILGVTFNKDVNLLISTELDLFHIRESGSDSGGSNLAFPLLLHTSGSTAHYKLDPSTDNAFRALTSPEADIEGFFTYSQNGFSFEYDQNDLPIGKSGAFLPLIESVTLVAHNELAVRFLSNVDTDITDGTGWILFGADAAGLAIKSNSDPGGTTDAMTLALNASLPDTATRFDAVHAHYQRPPADGDGATSHRGGIFNGTEYLDNARNIMANDGLPPVPVSAAAASATSTSITVTFSENVKGSHGTGSFSLSRAAGSATTSTPIPAVVPQTILTDSSTLTLGLDGPVGNNTLVISYRQDLEGSSMADVAGNPVASFANIPVGTPDVNRLPTAIISAPARVTEGDAVTLDGTASADDDGTISSYEWIANDTSITITNPSQATASFTAPRVTEDTSLVITLQVTDDDGDTGSANHTMTIANVNQRVTDPPRFVSAELDESAGVLNITFDKAIDASGVNATKFHIRESGSVTGGVTLSGASVTVTTPNTITLRLAEADRQTVIAMNTPYLEIDAGAVSDRSGNLLTESFDLTHDPSFSGSFYVAQDTQPVDIAFSPDGTKMFIMGIDHKTVRQYALSTPFDVTNASYNNKFFVVKTQDDTPLSIAFSPDGTKMFMMGGEHGAVRQYALSTPFDVTTASYSDEFFVVRHQDDQPVGITFSPDGTKMSMVGRVHDAVRQYALSTPFDVTTASYSDEFFVVRNQEKEPTGFAFSPDGTKIFIVGRQHDAVQQYALSTPFDITTASYNNKSFVVKTQDDAPNGIAFSSDGTKMFIIGNQHDRVYEYHMRLLYDINRLPTADAGPNQHVQEGDTVTLDGTGSADPDGGDDTLTYSWSQTSGSPAVTLTNANTTSPTFTAPSTTTAADPITLEFTLTASDSSSSNGTDTVTVTVYDDQTVFARSATYYENHGLLDITFNRDIDRTREIVFDSFLIRESGSNSGGSVLTSSEWLRDTAAGSTMTFRLNPSTDDAVGALTSPEIDIESFAVFGTNNILFNYDQVELPVVKSGAFLPLIDSVTLITHNELAVRFLSNVDTDITDGAGWILFGADAAGLAIKSNSDPGGTTDAMTLALNASLPGTATRFDDVHVHYQRPPADDAAGQRGGIFNGTEYLDNARDIKAADGLPPVPVSAAADSATSTSITVTFSENVKGSHGAGSFSLLRAAGSATTSIPIPAVVPQTILTDSSTLTLGLDGPVGNNTLVIGYNQDLEGSSMADVAGNPVASFANIPVSTPFTGDTGGGTPDANRRPIAEAGEPQTVNEGDTVTLDGTASHDPDGDPLTYVWEQAALQGEPPLRIEIDGATATFTAPQVTGLTFYTFTLTVYDGKVYSHVDTVNVIVNNSASDDPVADAGANQTENEGSTVTLDGTASADPNGDPLTYLWRQVSPESPQIALDDAASATPSFVAPVTLAAWTDFVFELAVDDGQGNSHTDTVTVTVRDTVSNRPVADAGANQTVNEGDTVTLDGTGSADPNGDPLTYSWKQDRPATPQLLLDDLNSPVANFVAPQVRNATEYVLELTVNDGHGNRNTDLVTITVRDTGSADPNIPVARAGGGQRVMEGSTVTLDGTASADPNGDPLTYLWRQISIPGAPTVQLEGANTATATFTAPAVDAEIDLVFELAVNDGDGNRDTDYVVIIVRDGDHEHAGSVHEHVGPTADAGPDQAYPEGTVITLFGGSSRGQVDGLDAVLQHRWIQLLPETPQVRIVNANHSEASFLAPQVSSTTEFLFLLTVWDRTISTGTDFVTMTVIDVAPDRPTAQAGRDQEINEGFTVHLNGRDSTDPNGDPLTYLWRQVSPASPQVSFDNATSSRTSFTAPTVSNQTDFVFELAVDDGQGNSHTDTVTVTVFDSASNSPTAEAGAAQNVTKGSTVRLDGTLSSDPNGDQLTYSWSQLIPNRPRVQLDDSASPTPSFTVPSLTLGDLLIFELIVDDGNGNTGKDNVILTVVRPPPAADAGPNQHVQEGDTVTLDGTNSTDPDGGDDTLTYSWSQTSGSPAVSLENANTTSPTFRAPQTGSTATLEFTLTASDDSLSNGTDTVTVTVYDDQTVFARSATYYENHGILGITFNRDIDRLPGILFDLFSIRESGSNSGGSDLGSSEWLENTAARSTMIFMLDPSTDDAVRALTFPEIDIEAFAVSGTNGIQFMYDQTELPVVKSGAFLPRVTTAVATAQSEITVRFLSNVDTDITNGTGWSVGASVDVGLEENLAVESNSDPGGTTDAMTLALNGSLPTGFRSGAIFLDYQRPSDDGTGIFNGTEYLGSTNRILLTDGIPPVIVNASAASPTATSITLTFSERITGQANAESFSLSRTAGSATTTPVPAVVSQVEAGSSPTITLNLNGTIGNNDLVIGYNRDLGGDSSMADIAGNPVASFADIPVATPPADPVLPTPPEDDSYAIDSPVPVASITDGQTHSNGKTFDELNGVYDIATVKIDTSTYALVVASTFGADNGVQIIDITDPANPAPVASFDKGDTVTVGNATKTFDELLGARAITTVKIDTSTYALVAAFTDNGVQIINVTNPDLPAPVASFDDGDIVTVNGTTKTFDTLRGTRTITTVDIDSSTYALVAASNDDGVQIVDITDPAKPVPTASFDDGDIVTVGDTEKTFDELNGARAITTVDIGSSTYALVASFNDDGVQIVDITDPTKPVPTASFDDGDTVEVGGTNKTFDELDQANGITTVKIDSSTYALVASLDDDGVQIVDITDPAKPVPTASFGDGDTVTVGNANRTFDELDGARAITTVDIGSSTYALVASFNDDGVQIVDITDPSNPFPTASFDDGDTVTVNGTTRTFDELDGARAITTVDIGSSTYALVASLTDNGVQIVGISSRSITNQPTVAPTLVSVERHDPATQSTNDTTPTFRATFSKAVTNVDAPDFVIIGDATATVSAVTPVSDTVYHVEVNVTADGIVNLGIDAGHNIQDAAGNSLSGTEPTDTDEPYTIDTAPPTLLAVTRIHPAAENTNDRNPIFRVIFGEAVTNVDKEDFETLGNATSTVSSATRIFDTQYDVLVTVTADGTVNLGIDAGHNITDVAGNALSDTTPTGANEPYTIDTVQPTILSIKRHNPLTENTTDSTPTFRVTFSEEVLEVNKPDFAITDSSSANATVSTVTPVPGSTVYDVGVTVTANGTVSLVLAGLHYIIDTASNSLSPADPPVSESYNVLLTQAENRQPTITLTGDNPATAERYVTYTDAGAACADPDGDDITLTSSSNVDTDTVSLPASPYRYTYSCTDQHGLAATNKTRLVSVEDTVKPVITLVGPASVPLTVGDTYTEEGATCTDSGRLLGAASIGGATVDTAVVNEYDVVYACSDGYNNAIPVTRTVTVTEPTITPPPPDVNVPPSASISAPPRAAEGTQVTLDGSGSTDTDGTIQSYNWTASNPAVAITGSNLPTASFIAPQVTEDTSLAITLKVTDDDGATNSAQHNMTITNTSPPPDDSAAPTFTARTGPATNQITVTFSKAVNSTADSHAAWGVAGSTVTAVTGLDGTGNTATLTLQSPVQPPDATPAVTYNADAGDISDVAGNPLATATVTAAAGHPAGLHIHLIGDAFLYHTYGEPYTDKGALCHDADGNDITDTGDYENPPYLNQTQTINATLHADTVLNFTHQSQNEYRPFDPQEVIYKCATSPSEFVEETRTVALRDDTPPEIRLNGPRDVDLEIGETFEETATCTDAPLKYQTELLNAAFYLTFRISFLPDGYQDTAGEHTISYTCSDSKGNDAEDTSRTLHVGTPDNTPPVLAVNPGVVTTLANGTHVVRQDVGFAAAGDGGGLQSAVSCTDNRDSTPAITLDPATVDTSVSGAHTITYSCTDAAGNPSNDITVTWDFGPAAPVLAVTPGDTQVTLALDASYEIPAASCTDHRDGDITGTGIVTAISSGGQPVDEIDTSSAGTYGITYSCTDSDDNTSEHNVTVTILPAVVDSTPPTIVLNPPEIIFVPVGGSFADADTGALCIDGQGNIIEGRTTVDATALDTAVLGNHTVTYSCTVSEENPQSSTISRTVSVYGFTVNGNIADFATDITTSDDYEEGIIQNITNIENPYQSIKYYDTAGQDTDSFDNQTRPAGTYTVQYTVSTPMSSPPITYTITETVTVVNATTQPDGNTPPIVAISVVPEVEAAEGTLVSLDGTNSRDDDGTISSYAWTTDDASIAITDADRPTASFTAPQVTEDTPLLITLRVTDNQGAPGSAQYTLIITDSESPVVPDTTPPTFTVDGHTGDFETSLTEGQTYRNGKIDNINETGSHPTSTEIRYYSGTGDVITTTDENEINSINNTRPAIGGYTIQYRVSDSAVSPNTHTITETLTVRAPATVTIGAIVSTTGSISSLGIPANDAIHLAVNDFNDRYLAPKEAAWRLAVSGYDDRSTSEGAIAALELLAGSNITSIVGPLTSDALSAVKGHALFDEPPRLAISYASTAPAEDLKQKDDRVFRTVPDDSNTVRAYVSLFEADSVDYVIPVFRNDAWGVALNRTLADEIDDHNNNNNNNNEITVHGGILYDPDTVSLSANTTLALLNDTLSRDSVSEKAPAVVVFGFSETLDILDEAAATANLPAAKWYGSDAVAPSKLLEGDTTRDENRRAFLERTDYNVLTLAIDQNEANKRIDRSVDNADVYSYAAYDAVYILGTAIHLNGGPAGNVVNGGLIGNITQVADNANGHYTDPAMGNTTLNEYGDLLQADYFVLSLDAGSGTSFEPEFRYYGSSGTLEGLVSSGGGGGGSSGDVSAPSIRTGFGAGQYPLVYDGVKYGPDTINSPHTATIRAGSGERLLSTLTVYENGGAQNVQHVDMFVAHDGRTIHNDGTETHVTYDSGNVRITDPHGLIASATVDASAIDATKAQFEFVITFAKKVPLSDVLYRLWDTGRNALYIHLEDALVVSEGRKGGSSSSGGGGGGGGSSSSGGGGGGGGSSSSSSSTVPPATGSGTTTTTTATGNGTAADTADKQQPQQPRQGFTAEQLDTLKQWGGFASQSASDSQLLAQFGIEGTSIPTYFKQTAKWFLDADADDADDGLTAQEFVAALSYLGQRGLLLN